MTGIRFELTMALNIVWTIDIDQCSIISFKYAVIRDSDDPSK